MTMKTEFTPEQIRVLAKAIKDAEAGQRRWIPAGCANHDCAFNDGEGRCELNNHQRQTCESWQRPEDMPTPARAMKVALGGVILLSILVSLAMWLR